MFSRAFLRDFRGIACALLCLALAIVAAGGAYLAFARKEKVGGFDDRKLLNDAREWLANADKAIAEKNWPRANVLLRWGVHAVGNDYSPADVLEHTEFVLFRADDEESKGNIESAVEARRELLAARMSLLQRKICKAAAVPSDQCQDNGHFRPANP